ncbi:uncharacterized protein EAE97_000309 [Botrytis byssoidea]|uniref:Uncharacterized protein n=1 Tax=Botrytis byssoidea TaxID=139641 RepID=A0A9P5M8Q2_9HELO|nr:uncharacterized protein EAE97_000309 [Botrytis byssoidea]KAF7955050.1 hypothetical protein EAE97_000309 [Botrytis byssoidea]
MSAYPRLRPDFQKGEASPTQETPNYLYICVLECENGCPFQFEFTLATGNASDIQSLTRHDLVYICPCVATEECGQVGLSYHQSSLRHSSQKVLTMIQIAKVKNQDLLCDALRKCDPGVDVFDVTSWYLRALDTLVWENRTGRILDIYWEFSFDALDDATERFTRASIVQGKIVEGFGNELADGVKIPVFDMARYLEMIGV